jgi:hypothetical protein
MLRAEDLGSADGPTCRPHRRARKGSTPAPGRAGHTRPDPHLPRLEGQHGGVEQRDAALRHLYHWREPSTRGALRAADSDESSVPLGHTTSHYAQLGN